MLSTRSLETLKATDAPKHDARFYSTCFMGGVLSCGTTHTFITPLDLVKCRRQTNPGMYSSLWDGLKKTAKTGWNRNGLYRGWQPTMCGYAMQGFFKFGGYELFKDLYINLMGADRAKNYKNTIYLAASASAEFFADIFLCPMEATKVRIQTTPVEANFPTKLGPAMKEFTKEGGVKSLWKGVVPLWCREHRRHVLQVHVHEASRVLQQGHAADDHLRFGLHCRYLLRCGVASFRLMRVEDEQLD